MLKDLFVPDEISTILHNLGFNWPTIKSLTTSDGLYFSPKCQQDKDGNLYYPPTYSKALDFLRIEYKIEITVLESYETPGKFEFEIISELIAEEIEFEDDHRDYYSCLIAAIMQSFEIIQKSKEVAL